MKKLLLTLALLLAGSAAHAATGDITAVRVLGTTCTATSPACNGWVAEIDITGMSTGGAYSFGNLADPANYATNAKGSITCTAPGYDTTGTATTSSYTVYMTHALRKPFPNQATMDETAGATMTIRVSLSDYIYTGFTSCTATIASNLYCTTSCTVQNNAVSGLAVTMNSTFAYPTSVCRWAKPGWEQVTGDFTLEAVCFNRFARNGKPLAAVVFTVSDTHSHTVTVTVNDMTVSTWGGDQQAVLVYAALISVSTLTQGDVLTANFKAYPWVGQSAAVVDTSAGTAPPSELLGPLKLLNDKSGTYGAAYVAVKTTGNDATCAANAVQATAEAATGCLTLGKAIQVVKTFNNTTYTRNNPGGGTALMFCGGFDYGAGAAGADQGAQDTWFTVQPASTASQACVKFTSGSNADLEVQKIKLTGVSFENASTGGVRGRNASDVLWIDNSFINLTGIAPIYDWKLVIVTRNIAAAVGDSSSGFVPFSTTPSPFHLVRGNFGFSRPAGNGISADMYCILGNHNVDPDWKDPGDVSTQQPTDNSIFAFNTEYNINLATDNLLNTGTYTKGTAIVQNVIEKVTTVDQLLALSGDNNTATSDNVMVWHNTFVGERENVAYNEAGTTANFHTNYSLRSNIFSNHNIKTDTFGTGSGARVGNWAEVYAVGYVGNDLKADQAGVYFSPDFDGLYTITGAITLGFSKDSSYATGDHTGNGNYEITAASGLRSYVPAGAAVLPYDLRGNVRANNGKGAIGAYEFLTGWTGKQSWQGLSAYSGKN
jgi:hypothetical protein